MNKLKDRIRNLMRSPKGRLVVVGGVAAVLALLVMARRKGKASAEGSPMTAGQVAADPRSSALAGADGTTWADYGMTQPFEGGYIGAGVGGGSVGDPGGAGGYDTGGESVITDWLADISGQLGEIQGPYQVAPAPEPRVESPTAPLPQVAAPTPAAPAPKFPGAKTFTDSAGNVRPIGGGAIIKPAPRPAQSAPKYPNAKTFTDGAGNVRPVGGGAIVRPAPAAPPPAAPRPAAPAPPRMTLAQAAANFSGPRTFKDGAGNTRRTAAWAAYLKSNGLA